MLKTIFEIFWGFVSWLKYPIYVLIGIFVLFYLLVFLNIIIGLLCGKRFQKGVRGKVVKHSFLRRIFIDLPKQFADDRFERNPEFFRHQRANYIRRSSRKWKNNSDDT